MSNVKSPSGLSAAVAADAALAAYLRAWADRRASELQPDPLRGVSTRPWSLAPLTRGRYQRVVPLREPGLERVLLSSRAEPRAAQRRGVR